MGTLFEVFFIPLKPLVLMIDRWILKEDLPNFKQVSSGVYRGGQPLGEGYRLLENKGIKTIINLRGIDTGGEHGTLLSYVHIPISPYNPQKEDVLTFLRAMDASKGQPVYIHCFHGSDRTGLFIAIYRVVYEGWTKEEALHEMVNGGHGFHASFQENLIQFFQDLDLENLTLSCDISTSFLDVRESHGFIGKCS
ncbi:MAG: dual specificity protein phosphatase family protein [Simkaniaceae bacterium]|nr:dual specificity protein phosphatase family protein [Simkaniaceae bacterium]